MKKTISLFTLLFILPFILCAQQESEILPEGIVFPRMTQAEMQGVSGIQGQCIYNTTFDAMFCFDGSTWRNINTTNDLPERIFDVDLDTGVETGLSEDDDLLRFFAGSFNEVMRHDGKTLHLLENGESVFIGEDAGKFDDISLNRNTAVGYNAGKFTTTGANNVAIGNQAMRDNSTGNNNVAVGKQALFKNVKSNNIAIGLNAALNSVTGEKNVSIGGYAGSNNGTGDRNTVIGYEAGQSVSGSNTEGNVLIGHQAGMAVNESNRLYIANDNTDEPLVYGEFDNSKLRVHGNLQVNDPASSGFEFPEIDGDSLQVLATDGNGTVEWANFSPTGVSFAGGSNSDIYLEPETAVPPRTLNFFLDIDGIPGTSQDATYTDQIVCYGYDFKQIGSSSSCNNLTFKIRKEVDVASPKLRDLQDDNTFFADAVFTVTNPNINVDNAMILSYTFSTASIKSVTTDINYAGNGEFRLYEEIEILIAGDMIMNYTSYNDLGEGTDADPITITCDFL